MFQFTNFEPKGFEKVAQAWADAFNAAKPKTFQQQVKADLGNAAYRVFANQMLSLTKNVLVQYSRKIFNEDSKILMFTDFLDTEIGKGIMGIFLGYAVPQVPGLPDDPRVVRLLKELRVCGMATVGNEAVDSLVQNILPLIASALSNIEEKQDSILQHLEESVEDKTLTLIK